MKLRTLIAGYVLALTIFLFAQHRGTVAQPGGYRAIVDLTHAINGQVPKFDPAEAGFQARTLQTIEKDGYLARYISLPEHFGTHIDAPAHFARGLWTVDQIPAERLLAPLVLIDVHDKVRGNPDYQLSVEDIAAWEHVNHQIPLAAVVMLRTGWGARWNSAKTYRNADAKGVMHFPGFSLDAAKFLVEARQALGLGIDTLSVDYGPSTDFPVHRYTLPQSLYHLENVANLEHVAPTGAIVVVAPMKIDGGSGGPVRILALLH
jgi:kynurenine formamidase